MDDLDQVAEGLSSLQLFAVYFDHHDQLFYTQSFTDGLFEMVEQEDRQMARYLTIVNDVWLEDGTTVQKDPELISRLVASEDRRRLHVDQLVHIAMQYNYTGIELDYERIKQDDWDGFIALINALYTELRKVDKSLRVVLEPGAPIEQLSFPEGPEYVIMAYNLYGTHSHPGPKADHHFLERITMRLKHVPGHAIIALSAGGFDWKENGDIKAITEQQAWQMAAQYNISPIRDEASDSLYFHYMDEMGLNHEVWFADGTTFSQWARTLRDTGYHRIAIWRLGELGEETLLFIKEAK